MASPEETSGELVPLRPGDGERGPVHPRAEMVKVLAEQGFGRNEIARRSGIPEVTVSRLADSLGISFDRSKTDEALKARLADLRQAQMGMALGLFEDIIEARIRLRTSSTARDFAFHSKAVGDLTQAYQRMIPEWTSEDDTENAKSLLGDLMEGIKVQAAYLDIWDEMYDRGEYDEIPETHMEYRRKKEASERERRDHY
ncbi:hypothetical protein C5L38_09255 [Streptomyces sp. WAC00288]|uniref:hypothetical protein n=1 Tax=unclassified Streptomyces TaxID=2593676 RepID=UPI0007876B35|nr:MULTISPECIES: hypothetical protein [unclassified Streptomyces]AVH95237.1 hypothetical protein C5L38_09255 [Streptomyces sp. WAC00288]KYG53931.1 hypothetical protein AWI43_05140 [Streptomyces sp. WAC04657]